MAKREAALSGGDGGIVSVATCKDLGHKRIELSVIASKAKQSNGLESPTAYLSLRVSIAILACVIVGETLCSHAKPTSPHSSSLQKERTSSVPNLSQNAPCCSLFLNQSFKKPTSEPETQSPKKLPFFIFAKLPNNQRLPKKETKTGKLSFLKPMSPKSKCKTESRAPKAAQRNNAQSPNRRTRKAKSGTS